MLSLRPYQEEALQAIRRAWDEGVRRMLLALPTGAGKTVIFAHAIAERGREKREGIALVLAHRRELLDQAEEKFRIVWPQARIGRIQGPANIFRGADIVLASVQTLSRPARLEALAKSESIHTLIVDEAHHAAARTYRRILDRLFHPDMLLLGVTATPFRSDQLSLESVFERLVYQVDLLSLIRAGYLADLRIFRIYTSVSLDPVKLRGKDYDPQSLRAVLNTRNRNELILRAYLRYARGKRTVCFAIDTTHARDLKEIFQKAGVHADVVSEKHSPRQRAAILRRFREGQIQVLINCMLLTEGWDDPGVEAIIIARPTRSRVLYFQMIGRGTRLYPGKTECLLLDFADASLKHPPVHLFDLLPGETEPPPEEGLPRRGVSLREASLQMERPEGIDIQASEERLLARSRLRWVVLGQRMFLSTGNQTGILLYPVQPGRYRLYEVDHKNRQYTPITQAALPASYAITIAEETAQKKAASLVSRDAKWRNLPPTPKQAELLRKLGHSPTGLTRGDASDIINEIFVRRQLAEFNPEKAQT
ncbi:MAG: DEAD/DEAH box helicase [Clostridiales bacterium]|nr:DEAD/DEAH box helicase [Clostridiales bacterium]